MPVPKRLILLGVVVIAFVAYFWRQGAEWADVEIKRYEGKLLSAQELGRTPPMGIEKRSGNRVRGYFSYGSRNEGEHPVVRAYLNGEVVISHEVRKGEESLEKWRLSGSLDGEMKEEVPGGGKVIQGSAHGVEGWTIEWWRHPEGPIKVIILTNPGGKSRTFKVEWTRK
jgi:hypothetical protein